MEAATVVAVPPLELVKAFGEHIVYSKAYNEHQIMIEKSIKKIEEYKDRKQLKSLMSRQQQVDSTNKDIKRRQSKIIRRMAEPGTINDDEVVELPAAESE
jgi:hypothetical protein